MSTKSTFLTIALVALFTGCEPSSLVPIAPTCAMQFEAEKVGLAYEEVFDIALSPEDFKCLHDFEVAFADVNDTGADVRGYRLGNLIVLQKQAWEEHDAPETGRTISWFNAVTLRHELIHQLLDCVKGDPDADHSDPVWAGQTHLSWIPDTVPYVAENENPGTYQCPETASTD